MLDIEYSFGLRVSTALIFESMKYDRRRHLCKLVLNFKQLKHPKSSSPCRLWTDFCWIQWPYPITCVFKTIRLFTGRDERFNKGCFFDIWKVVIAILLNLLLVHWRYVQGSIYIFSKPWHWWKGLKPR
jgi:hypothetical protein